MKILCGDDELMCVMGRCRTQRILGLGSSTWFPAPSGQLPGKGLRLDAPSSQSSQHEVLIPSRTRWSSGGIRCTAHRSFCWWQTSSSALDDREIGGGSSLIIIHYDYFQQWCHFPTWFTKITHNIHPNNIFPPHIAVIVTRQCSNWHLPNRTNRRIQRIRTTTYGIS